MDASAAHATKKNFTTPTSGLEDVYFTWGILSDAARYAKVVGKLKEYASVHFRDQIKVVARAMGKLKAPGVVKLVCPVRMYWADKGRTHKTTKK